jgi:26S proteasome non-ATPase regulatory subunit 9
MPLSDIMSDVIPPSSGDAKATLRALMTRKEGLEAQLEALQTQSAQGQQLVDAEGFPRGDLDVHTIRNARAELARMQTDHKALMKSIETALFAVHAEAKAAKLAANPAAVTSAAMVRKADQPSTDQPVDIEAQLRADEARRNARAAKEDADAAMAVVPASVSAAAPAQPVAISRPTLLPFYRVASVSADSPAASAGLREGDLITQFGSVSATNVSAAAMGAVVAASVGRGIPVTILRAPSTTPIQLRLVPQQWSGRGMLGCHLVDA